MTPADQHALREALARAEAERDEARRHSSVIEKHADELHQIYVEAIELRRAAEAENTRLKETVEAAEEQNDRLVEMVEKLVLNATTGSVPRAIIAAAGSLLDTPATIPPKENPDA